MINQALLADKLSQPAAPVAKPKPKAKADPVAARMAKYDRENFGVETGGVRPAGVSDEAWRARTIARAQISGQREVISTPLDVSKDMVPEMRRAGTGRQVINTPLDVSADPAPPSNSALKDYTRNMTAGSNPSATQRKIATTQPVTVGQGFKMADNRQSSLEKEMAVYDQKAFGRQTLGVRPEDIDEAAWRKRTIYRAKVAKAKGWDAGGRNTEVAGVNKTIQKQEEEAASLPSRIASAKEVAANLPGAYDRERSAALISKILGETPNIGGLDDAGLALNAVNQVMQPVSTGYAIGAKDPRAMQELPNALQGVLTVGDIAAQFGVGAAVGGAPTAGTSMGRLGQLATRYLAMDAPGYAQMIRDSGGVDKALIQFGTLIKDSLDPTSKIPTSQRIQGLALGAAILLGGSGKVAELRGKRSVDAPVATPEPMPAAKSEPFQPARVADTYEPAPSIARADNPEVQAGIAQATNDPAPAQPSPFSAEEANPFPKAPKAPKQNATPKPKPAEAVPAQDAGVAPQSKIDILNQKERADRQTQIDNLYQELWSLEAKNRSKPYSGSASPEKLAERALMDKIDALKKEPTSIEVKALEAAKSIKHGQPFKGIGFRAGGEGHPETGTFFAATPLGTTHYGVFYGGGRPVAHEISLRNPAVYDTRMDFAKASGSSELVTLAKAIDGGESNFMAYDKVAAKVATELGYDGIVYKKENYGIGGSDDIEIVVLKPNPKPTPPAEKPLPKPAATKEGGQVGAERGGYEPIELTGKSVPEEIADIEKRKAEFFANYPDEITQYKQMRSSIGAKADDGYILAKELQHGRPVESFTDSELRKIEDAASTPNTATRKTDAELQPLAKEARRELASSSRGLRKIVGKDIEAGLTPAPEPSTAPKAQQKEPWQMTREEYVNDVYKRNGVEPDDPSDPVYQQISRQWEDEIRKAHGEGKPISPEALRVVPIGVDSPVIVGNQRGVIRGQRGDDFMVYFGVHSAYMPKSKVRLAVGDEVGLKLGDSIETSAPAPRTTTAPPAPKEKTIYNDGGTRLSETRRLEAQLRDAQSRAYKEANQWAKETGATDATRQVRRDKLTAEYQKPIKAKIAEIEAADAAFVKSWTTDLQPKAQKVETPEIEEPKSGLPRTRDEFEKAKAAYRAKAKRLIKRGGELDHEIYVAKRTGNNELKSKLQEQKKQLAQEEAAHKAYGQQLLAAEKPIIEIESAQKAEAVSQAPKGAKPKIETPEQQAYRASREQEVRSKGAEHEAKNSVYEKRRDAEIRLSKQLSGTEGQLHSKNARLIEAERVAADDAFSEWRREHRKETELNISKMEATAPKRTAQTKAELAQAFDDFKTETQKLGARRSPEQQAKELELTIILAKKAVAHGIATAEEFIQAAANHFGTTYTKAEQAVFRKAWEQVQPKQAEPKDLQGFAQADTAVVREAVGIDPYQKSKKSDATLIQNVKKRGLVNDAEYLAKKILAGHVPTDEEGLALGIRFAQTKNELALRRADVLGAEEGTAAHKAAVAALDEVDARLRLLADASDVSGSEQGRSFRARRMAIEAGMNIDPANIDEVLFELARSKGVKVSQIDQAHPEVVKLKARVAELEQLKSDHEKAIADLQNAKAVSGAARMANRPRAARTIEHIRADRAAAAAEFKSELVKAMQPTAIGSGVGSLESIIQHAPKAAKALKKIIELYIEEYKVTKIDKAFYDGVRKTIDEYGLTHPETGDKLSLSDTEIRDVFAGMYDKTAVSPNKVKTDIQSLREQAKVLKRIEDVQENRATKKGKDTPVNDAEISKAQEWLSTLRDAEKDAKTVKRIQDTIDSLEDQKQGKWRNEPVKRNPLTHEDMRAKVAELRKDLRLEDKVADLENQLQTRDFRGPDPRVQELTVSQLKLAAKIKRLSTEVRAQVKLNAPQTWADKISNYIGASVLSNPAARVLDVTANTVKLAAYLTMNPLRVPTHFALDRLLLNSGALGGGERIITIRKLRRSMDGYWESVKKDKRDIMGGTDADTAAKFGRGTLISKLTGLTDIPFKEFYSRLAIDDLALNEARRELGKRASKAEVEGRAKEIAADPTEEMMVVAHDWALRQTFNVDNFFGKMQQGVRATTESLGQKAFGETGKNIGRVVGILAETPLRFSKVIGNVALERVNYYPPAGLGEAVARALIMAKSGYSPIQARLIADLTAKGLVGIALFYAGQYAVQNGMYKPQIVKTPNGTMFIDNGNTEQIGGPFGPFLAGANAAAIERASLTDKQRSKLKWDSNVGLLLDQPFFGGIKEIGRSQGDPRGMEKLAARTAFTLVPGSSAIREWAKTQDSILKGKPYDRERRVKTKNFIEDIQKNVPFWRESLPDAGDMVIN